MQTAALAAGAKGAGFAGVLGSNRGRQFASAYFAGDRHHIVNGFKTAC
jgi:hypothetical protein